MSCDHCHKEDPPPPGGGLGLSSTLNVPRTSFATGSTPAGGAALGRGESFASLGGEYVFPRGFLSSASPMEGSNGGTIVSTPPSVGGLMAYKVMEGFQDQVVSPVTVDGQNGLSVHVGTSVNNFASSVLGRSLRTLDMAAQTPAANPHVGRSTRGSTSAVLYSAMGALKDVEEEVVFSTPNQNEAQP
jgi:hypothetical protein